MIIHKYYTNLERPNNEYLDNGYLKYESQLNKTFNLFLFSLCNAFTANRYQGKYINIVLDVNPDTREITKVKFIPQLFSDAELASFQYDFREYYGYEIGDGIPVLSALELIKRIAPTTSQYFSVLPNPKPQRNESEQLRTFNDGEMAGLQHGYDAPLVEIYKDSEGREVIEVGTNSDNDPSIFKGYFDDFLSLIGRLPMSRKYIAEQTTKPQ